MNCVARWAFYVLLAAYCVWVFTLPVFPTQDGPAHLYYSQIFKHLLAGNPEWQRFFAIRIPPPPYLLHYLLLIVFTTALPALIAEKVFICLVMIVFACGFRSLARSIGHAGDIAALWALPLCLNWPFGMGFHNYCVAMGLGFFAIAAWIQGARSKTWSPRWMFLVLVLLMLAAHPVPLFVTLAFAVGEMVIRKSHSRRDWAILLGACCSLMYVFFFIARQRTEQNLQTAHWDAAPLLSNVFLFGGTTSTQIFYYVFEAAVIVALVIALCRIHRRAQPALLLTGALIFALAVPALPHTLNGSDFFSDRLVIYIPLLIFAAGSSALTPKLVRYCGAAAAILLACGALVLANKYMRPVANRIAQIERDPLPAAGKLGFFLPLPVNQDAQGLQFNAYFWAATRYFRRTDTIMLNAPWLDLPICPIAPRGDAFSNRFSPAVNNYPWNYIGILRFSPKESAIIGHFANFVVVVGRPGYSDGEGLVSKMWPTAPVCDRQYWYEICSPGE